MSSSPPPCKIKKCESMVELNEREDNPFSENIEIIIKDGFRWVCPYLFNFKCFAKQKWVGKSLLDVYTTNFSYTADEVQTLINKEKIKVCEKIVDSNFIIKDNMTLSTLVHRHEFPVPNTAIQVVFEDEELYVINKPAGIPVHPSGRFRHNSIVNILSRDYNISPLFCSILFEIGVHRLDRFTSGILIFAKSSIIAEKLSNVLRKREVKKFYLCKVSGLFPEKIICDSPLNQVSFKFALCMVEKKGKASKTYFKRIHFDEEFSYVACYPQTGRMHQIRVHLQYLGFPIVGDYIYNHPTAFGENKGKGGVFIDKKEVLKSLVGDKFFDKYTPDNQETVYFNHKKIEAPEEFKNYFDEECKDCRELVMMYPLENMHLHSYSYQFDKWKFVTEIPTWFKFENHDDLNIEFEENTN